MNFKVHKEPIHLASGEFMYPHRHGALAAGCKVVGRGGGGAAADHILPIQQITLLLRRGDILKELNTQSVF
jgi:hypothetical protein